MKLLENLHKAEKELLAHVGIHDFCGGFELVDNSSFFWTYKNDGIIRFANTKKELKYEGRNYYEEELIDYVGCEMYIGKELTMFVMYTDPGDREFGFFDNNKKL